jgi:hypothetical protein
VPRKSEGSQGMVFQLPTDAYRPPFDAGSREGVGEVAGAGAMV